MPIMPRPEGKAKKIAYDILGIPGPMQPRKKKPVRIEKRLEFEETSRNR